MAAMGVNPIVAGKVVVPLEVGEAKEMAVDGQVEEPAIHPAVAAVMHPLAVAKRRAGDLPRIFRSNVT